MFGNRINALGKLVFTSSVVASYFLINNLSEMRDQLGDFSHLVEPFLVFSPAFLAGMGIYSQIITDCGKGTYEIYKRTKNHIQNFGGIDERFAKKIFEKKHDKISIKDSSMRDYCELQGIYLAAKELNHANTFNELKKKYYNKSFPLF